MVWARQQKVGKPIAKSILIVLGELCDDEGKTTRSQGYIADILEIGRTAMKANLGHLEEGGWVKRERRMSGPRRLSDCITLALTERFTVDLSDAETSEGPGDDPTTEGTADDPTGRAARRPPEGPRGDPPKGREATPLKENSFNSQGNLFTSPTADAAEPQLGPTGYPTTAQGLLAEWIDNCTIAPMPRVKGHMAREIKNCIEAGAPFEAVRNGVIEVHQKGLNPGTLQSVVHTLLQSGLTGMAPTGQHRGPAGRATGTQRAMQALQAGANLQAATQSPLALEGTGIGSRAGLSALGEGSTGGQPPSGRNDDSGVVGNPRPFVIQ